MKYYDSVEQSEGYLGPVLSLMAKQAAAMDPVSYAVWYEYVSGINVSLKTAIDQHLHNCDVFDEHLTTELFNRHISDVDLRVARDFSEGFQKVMEEMLSSAAQAGDQAGLFETALEKWSADWVESNSGGNNQADTILGLTRQMQGSIVSLRGSLDDSRLEIAQLQVEVRKAREDACVDGLTGLTNRRGFDLAITAALLVADAGRVGPCLIMADIDHFKQVNDTYGHPFGDRVIQGIAQILKNSVRGKGIAARYGGEEFVVLLPDMLPEEARQLAEAIRGLVEKCRIKRSSDSWGPADISVSLGVTGFKAGESAASFVGRADIALYASKHDGRNRVTVAAT